MRWLLLTVVLCAGCDSEPVHKGKVAGAWKAQPAAAAPNGDEAVAPAQKEAPKLATEPENSPPLDPPAKAAQANPQAKKPPVGRRFDPKDAKATALWLGLMKMEAFITEDGGNLFAAKVKREEIEKATKAAVGLEIRWELPISSVLADGGLILGGFLIKEDDPAKAISTSGYIFDQRNIFIRTNRGVRYKQHFEVGVEPRKFDGVDPKWLATAKPGDLAVVTGRVASWSVQAGAHETTDFKLSGAAVVRPTDRVHVPPNSPPKNPPTPP